MTEKGASICYLLCWSLLFFALSFHNLGLGAQENINTISQNVGSLKHRQSALGITIDTDDHQTIKFQNNDLPLFDPASILSNQSELVSQTEPLKEVTPSAEETQPKDKETIEEIEEPVTYLKSAIEALEKDVEVAKNSDEALARQRIEIDALISGADLYLESLQPRYRDLQEQIQKLGPAPNKDQSPEASGVAEERLRITAMTSVIDGAIKSTGLVQYRAQELLTHVQDLRTQIFTSELFRRHRSPFTLETWDDILKTAPSTQDTLKWTLWRWQRIAQNNFLSLISIIVSGILIYAGLVTFRKKVFLEHLEPRRALPPPFFQRAGMSGLVAFLLALPSSLALIIVAYGFDHLGLWYLDKERHLLSVLPPLLAFIGVASLAQAIFQPRRPLWRLLNLDNSSAAALTKTLTAIGFVYAIDSLLKETIRILAMPLSVSIAIATLSSLALSLLLFKTVYTRFTYQKQSFFEEDPFTLELNASPHQFLRKQKTDEEVSRFFPLYLKLPLVVVALFILGASFTGYIALGRFVAQQVIVSGSLIILVLLLQIALRVLISREIHPEKFLGRDRKSVV